MAGKIYVLIHKSEDKNKNSRFPPAGINIREIFTRINKKRK
jgi:hypothetical protein